MEFKLYKNRIPKFNKSKSQLNGKYIIKDGDIYISLEWKFLQEFGSNKQLIYWDEFRREYITKLLNSVCNKNCFYTFIGSNSIFSDIDINIINQDIENDVISKVVKDHNKRFKKSLEVMFDINLYGSIFHYLSDNCAQFPTVKNNCFPKVVANYKQRCWSFSRIVQNILTLNDKDKSIFLNSLPYSYQKLFHDSLILYNKYIDKYTSEDYTYLLNIYLKSLKSKQDSPETLMNKYSICKLFEKDSYRTAGAVLHIVYKNKLSKLLYYDSVYDNLGFIFNILKNAKKCDINTMLKVAKYLERIIDAVQLIRYDTKLSKFKDDLKFLNESRKMEVKPTNVKSVVDEMYDQLGFKYENKIKFLVGITKFVIDAMPKDELLYK